MHELAITESLLDIVREKMKDIKAAKLLAVGIRVGRLTTIVPDSLDFCFQALIKDTPLEGAVLDIDNVSATGFCPKCRRDMELEDFVLLCPKCGSFLQIKTGEELEITHLEVE